MAIEIIADYHTHTQYSDGLATISENVAAARKKGLKRIALTDHGMRHMAAGMRKKYLPEYRKEIDRLNAHYAGEIEILMGIESNILSMDGRIDVTEETRSFFDIILMGYHITALSKNVQSFWHYFIKAYLLKLSGRENVCKATTRAYVKAVENSGIDIVVHPKHVIELDMEPLARACARNDVAIEISARSNHLKYSVEEAQAAKAAGAFFVVDSDGHNPAEIGVFDQALHFAEMAGFTEADIINAKGYDGPLPANLRKLK